MSPTNVENQFASVLCQWVLIIGTAWIVGRIGKKVGQPLAVSEIFAGILLGPSVLGLIWPADWAPLFPEETKGSLQLLGRLGLILLLFQVGMEFDYSHLRSRSSTVTAVSVFGIIFPAIGGVFIAPWLHRNFAPHVDFNGFRLFIAIALSISALPVMGRILLEMKLERTPLGVMSISAAAIDDIIGWVGLAVITALATAKFSWQPVLIEIGGVLLLAGVLFYVIGPGLRSFWAKTVKEQGSEAKIPPSFLALLLIGLFLCCTIAHAVGVFAMLGAFLFGVALHQQTDLVKAWREQFSGFVAVALVPIFFTNTGLRTEIGSLNSGLDWAACGLILFMAVIGKVGGCGLAAKWTGRSNRESMGIAALMNTRGLMGLVAINVGYDLKLLPRELFTMFVLMALATTAMTGPLLRRLRPEKF